jgi:hypothetical protein
MFSRKPFVGGDADGITGGMHGLYVSCVRFVGSGVSFVCIFNLCIKILFSSFKQFHALGVPFVIFNLCVKILFFLFHHGSTI